MDFYEGLALLGIGLVLALIGGKIMVNRTINQINNIVIPQWINWFKTHGKEMAQSAIPNISLKQAAGYGLAKFFDSGGVETIIEKISGKK